jgi:hypothetical protein
MLIVTVLVAGCGSGPIPVRGRVTLDGTPVSGAAVLFVPAGTSGRPANGRTDASGVFRLTTFKQEDGALPGDYKVVVTKTDPLPEPPPAEPGNTASVVKHYKGLKTKETSKKKQLPPAYADAAKTPLHCTVPAGGEVELKLESSAK